MFLSFYYPHVHPNDKTSSDGEITAVGRDFRFTGWTPSDVLRQDTTLGMSSGPCHVTTFGRLHRIKIVVPLHLWRPSWDPKFSTLGPEFKREREEKWIHLRSQCLGRTCHLHLTPVDSKTVQKERQQEPTSPLGVYVHRLTRTGHIWSRGTIKGIIGLVRLFRTKSTPGPSPVGEVEWSIYRHPVP